MTGDLIPIQPSAGAPALALAGRIADQAAGANVFSEYKDRRAANTLKRQKADLALFTDYLSAAGVPALGDFFSDPAAWRGITWGIVAGFVRWLLAEGYSIGSVNVRLSTIKTYAALAAQAGALEKDQLPLIQTVKGYKRADAIHLDEKRTEAGQLTRREWRRGNQARNRKKTQAVSISPARAAQLKAQPDTPQGRRDRLLMCLLLDHGLRISEAARLTVDCFDLSGRELRFYRPKVDKEAAHKLTADTLSAARAYFQDAPALGSIWRASHKGRLTQPGMTARALTARVTTLAEAIGISGLSAHDCRHYAATFYAGRVNRGKLNLKEFCDIFGWTTPTMALRYIESARVLPVDEYNSD